MAWVPARHWSLGGKAAVDDELGAGDERSFVGGEEQHSIGDLDRLADAAQRRQGDLVVALTGVGRIQHRRHVARMHGVDPHPRRPVAHRGGLGIDPHGTLRGVIGRVTAGAADKSHDRTDIDDRPATGLRHLFGGELGAEKDARLIDRDDPVPAVQTVGIADRAAGDAGVVHQDVEPAVGRQRFADQARPFGFAGDVDFDCGCCAAAGPDRGGNRLGIIGQDVGDDDLRTLGREGPSRDLDGSHSVCGEL